MIYNVAQDRDIVQEKGRKNQSRGGCERETAEIIERYTIGWLFEALFYGIHCRNNQALEGKTCLQRGEQPSSAVIISIIWQCVQNSYRGYI